MKLIAGLVFLTATITTVLSGVSSRNGGKGTLESRIENYRRLLGQFFAQARHPFVNEEQWLYARYGVETEFTSLLQNVPRVNMELQNFKTDVFAEKNIPIQVDGQNIIVTFQGNKYGTSEDEILLVGAHYDSDSTTLGISDNGSGVVAMLEVARTLAALLVNAKAQLRYTVMFVAFDVQKLEHEITGHLDRSTGSHYFVREILDGMLSRPEPPRFKGAIILDSILNYNNSAGTQILPDGFQQSFQEAFQSISSRNYTGDYLALVSKENLRSARLDYLFNEHWTAVDSNNTFPVVKCEIFRNTASPAVFEFLKQDHLPFWNYLQNNAPKPLPAILLTDTGKWRGMPSHCAQRSCALDDILDLNRLRLLDQMVLTINRIISHVQLEAPVNPMPDSGSRFHLNVVSILFLTLIARLLS